MTNSYVISGGHGKKVQGAVGYLKEYETCKDIARDVHEILEKDYNGKGWLYNETTAITQRANLSNIVKFHNSKPRSLDIFIHLNASNNENATGVEVLYYTAKSYASKMSKAIANTLKLVDRGAKQRKDLYVLKNTLGSKKPKSILIETFFCTNLKDSSSYKQNNKKLAHAIAKVIAEELGYKQQTTSGFHTVTVGDSLSSIAKKYKTSLTKLKELNSHLKDFNVIKVGEKIRVK